MEWKTEAAAKEPAPAGAHGLRDGGGRHDQRPNDSTDPHTALHHNQSTHQGVCLHDICRAFPCPRNRKKPRLIRWDSVTSTTAGSSRQVQLYPRLTDALPIGLATSTSVDQPSRAGRPSGLRWAPLQRDWLRGCCAVGRLALSRTHTASSLRRGRKKGNFSAA